MTLILRRTLLTAGLAILVALAAVGAVRVLTDDSRNASEPPVGLTGAAVHGPAASAITPATIDGPTATQAESAGAAGQDVAAALDAVLAVDTTTTDGPLGGARLRRLAAWDRLVHATLVVDLKKGGLTTVQLDHGTITAVSAGSVTIAEAGGGSVTVTLGSETRVRRAGAKAAIGDLKAADRVFVITKVGADGTEAYLVVVPKA